ncbi:MAG: DUF1616 domain-containing protein [Archaeoglobaceae archaeon]|nr:DUF1616 domain-containing protein [Archaeoglobaceae archaeon]MCX8151420.1 DUF1616 domain-containing protein [Archaeoglobaceae archaeon]MDW8014371.1 DUF1616 domain-containing protein [Archaeoglobaceae archaeon]
MKDWDLITVLAISISFTALISVLEDQLRIFLGIFFILFLPGYSITSFLFPEKSIDNIERIALSFGLSIAVVPLLGLILNYTPFGINLISILISVSAINVIFSILAIFRRKRSFDPFRPEIKKLDLGKSKVEKVLTAILLISIVFSISALIYIISNPKQPEKFTEFYILGEKGKASDYPTKLFVKQKASVIVGIVNHEQRSVNYTVEVWLARMSFEDGRILIKDLFLLDSFNVTLEHKPLTEKWEPQWEKVYNFSIDRAGKYKVFFLLFKDSVPPLPYEANRTVNFSGTDAEKRILDAIDGKIQSLILNVEVVEI